MVLINAGGALLVLPILLVYMLVVILLESLIMHLLKYNRFSKGFWQASIANLVSLGGGIAILDPLLSRAIEDGPGAELLALLFLFLVTLFLEGIVIYLFNRHKPFRQSATVVLVMYVSSYVLSYLLFMMTVR